jgi:RimJ/RimL family protein N-acetyltransferase
MITLRTLQGDDLDGVHALISNMEVVRYMLLPVCSREESEKFLSGSINETPSDPWRSIVRAIVSGPDGELVGLCGLVNLRGNSDGEIWYLINPRSWGKGIATKAVKQLLQVGFSEMHLHRIWATCLPENPASARAGKGRHAKRRISSQEPWDSRRILFATVIQIGRVRICRDLCLCCRSNL